MGVFSIGAKLVRDTKFGRVITETVGNKVFTNVYDLFGVLKESRVKQISRMQIGNKKVISVSKVTQENGIDGNKIDKVYNSQGEFLGYRSKTISSRGEKYVDKAAAKGKVRTKYFRQNGISDRRCIELSDGDITVNHNNKGLPIGQYLRYDDKNVANMSLKEMRLESLKKKLRGDYLPTGTGLELSLNRVEDLITRYVPKANETLNDLDKLLYKLN